MKVDEQKSQAEREMKFKQALLEASEHYAALHSQLLQHSAMIAQLAPPLPVDFQWSLPLPFPDVQYLKGWAAQVREVAAYMEEVSEILERCQLATVEHHLGK